VVICSKDRPQLLGDALRAILELDRLPNEVVVLDQSAEPNPAVAGCRSTPGVEIVYNWSPGSGLSVARNQAVTRSTGDLLLFIDDDILVSRDWLSTMVCALSSRGPRHVVTGRIDAGPPEVAGGWAPSTITRPLPRSYAGRIDEDVLYPNNMGLARSAVAEVGPFDERLGAGARFPAAEDNDLCFRLLRAGYVIDYVPEVVVQHRAWRAQNDFVALRYSYGKGQGAFYAKHMSLKDLFMARRLTVDAARHLARALKRFLRGREKVLVVGDLAYVRGLLVGALTWQLQN
jgi:GT2 family glycosyltransferase